MGCLLLARSLAIAQPCPAPANWFPHSQTPAPNPYTFPTNATDCDFHQWAWQMFLWITQNVGGQPRFLTFPTDADMFLQDPNQKPLNLTALIHRPSPPPLRLKVRNIKAKAGGAVENPNSIFQATRGILVAQDGNPLYYSVHLDWTFFGFVLLNGYYDYNTYTNAGPNKVFPPGATELKASWQIVPANSKLKAFTTQAQVPTLSTDGGGNIIAGLPLRTVTVALVGLHVVGVVANHPEFIWATFEQASNAPDLPSTVSPTNNTPVSSSNFTFYAAKTFASQCNQQASSYTLNPARQTLSPITQVFRQFADGGGIPDNITAIDTLNRSVHSQLSAGDVWNNYNLIGGVWLLPGDLKPNLFPPPPALHGSTNLVNSTMETFAQPYQGYTSSCFSCHNTGPTQTDGGLSIPAMNMNLSHVLTDGLVTQENARRKLMAK